MVRRSFKVLPMPDRVVRLANRWGETSRVTARHGTGVDFVNHVGKPYDWANESLDVDRDSLAQPSSTAYPSIPAEIPGVELESDYEDVTSAIEEEAAPTLAERAATACRNASIEPASGTQAETAGVEKTDVIDVTEDKDDYPSETRVKVEEESNDKASENGSEDGADPYKN